MNQNFIHLKRDIPAALVVFLVALPLCLGVALASGAPLISGLISGIIGGIVVGFLSGSNTSVSGPAAGLTAIVLSSISQLGSFEVFVMALVLAGIIQVILGIARAGIIANYFPSSVIKGLLAAIGIILIFKQIPHAVGYDKDAEGDFSFFQRDGENTFSELLTIVDFITPGAVVVALVSIAILLLWDNSKMKKFPVPAALVVVVAGIGINELLRAVAPDIALGAEHLVSLPVFNDTSAIAEGLIFPDWSQWANPKVYMVALTLAIVASLETLLNLEAIDKLDMERRYSPPNKELIAQGIGNITSGLIGGLPITSVVVRSSVNLSSGGKTRMATILHGVLILVSLLFIPGLLNMIPLSALAAILLITGYKLASVGVFKKIYKQGISQFLPFITTVVAIVFTDLLTGIVIGLTVGLFFVLRNDFKSGFKYSTEKYPSGEIIRIKISQHATFLNKSSFVNMLNALPENTEVIMDATDTDYIDEDILEAIKTFREECDNSRCTVRLSMVGFKDEYKIPDYIRFASVITREVQQELTPQRVLQILKEGNERFLKGESRNKDLLRQAQETHREQHPMAAVLGCIDSRSTSELVFDLGLGDIFSARVAGNIANSEIIGSLEFATKVAGAKLIVVLGHTNCGAIKAACDDVKLGNITSLLANVRPAIEAETTTTEERNSRNEKFVGHVTQLNVKLMMEKVRRESPLIDEMLSAGAIGMAGAVHNLKSGVVHFIAFNREWEK